MKNKTMGYKEGGKSGGRSPEKQSRRLMMQAADKKIGKKKPRTQKLIDKVIDKKTMMTRDEAMDQAMRNPDATEVLTDRGFEKIERKAGGGKVRGVGAALGGYGKGPYSDQLI